MISEIECIAFQCLRIYHKVFGRINKAYNISMDAAFTASIVSHPSYLALTRMRELLKTNT